MADQQGHLHHQALRRQAPRARKLNIIKREIIITVSYQLYSFLILYSKISYFIPYNFQPNMKRSFLWILYLRKSWKAQSWNDTNSIKRPWKKMFKTKYVFLRGQKLLNPSRENYCLVVIYFSDIPVNFQIKSIFKLATMFIYWGNHICSLYSGDDVNNKDIFLAINFSRSVGHFVYCLLSTHWNLLLFLDSYSYSNENKLGGQSRPPLL